MIARLFTRLDLIARLLGDSKHQFSHLRDRNIPELEKVRLAATEIRAIKTHILEMEVLVESELDRMVMGDKNNEINAQ